MNEKIEDKRKRLIFRSWHRGTKEMDLLLGSFADKYVPNFDEQELVLFDELLHESDPNLYNWVCKREPVPANMVNSVLEQFLSHSFVSKGS